MHCALLSSLLLLAFPTLAFAAWDHFQFDITFFCNYLDRPNYNLKIEWWEDDSASRGELITPPKLLRPNMGKTSFSMDGAMNGDEKFSAGYHPVAYISHDCTDDRKRVDLILDITTLCEIGYSSCHYRIIKDITNTWGRESMAAQGYELNNLDPFPGFP